VKQHSPRLSQTENNELRANGGCFECKEKGHLSEDCPKRNSIHPLSRVHAAADIGNIKNIAERLDWNVSSHLLQLNMVNVPSPELPSIEDVKEQLIPT